MSMIKIENLSYTYPSGSEPVFENLNFQIDSDWKLGLIGRNGCGKTTLFRLLMGADSYSGRILSQIPFAYFPYPVKDPERLTTEILSEICPLAEEWEFMRELGYLEAEIEILYRPFDTLSHGEQTKALLAALFLNEDQFLLIDEPTNHLDLHARELVAAYLNRKKGFLLVSHDRSFLDGCVDHILAFNRSSIEIQKGTFSSWWENKEQRDSLALATNEKLKKEISRLSEASRRTSNWSDQVEKSKSGTTNSGSKLDKGFVGHKSAKMMKRAKNLETRQQEAIREKSGLLSDIETVDSLKMQTQPYHADLLVRAAHLTAAYDDRILFSDLTFEVHQGDRIALDGKNGTGKSTLLKLILDAADAREDQVQNLSGLTMSGELSSASGLQISYVSQETADLMGTLSDYAEKHHIEESLFLTVLRKLGFARAQFAKRIEDFSEGQKKKVLLARSLTEPAHLYIWDEPLNYIDIYFRMQLEELIEAYHPTMLFVEHDRTFREQIATKILEL